jgi:hypothetical protein
MSVRIPSTLPVLAAFSAALWAWPLMAATLDVTSAPSAVLAPQAHLTVEFGVWNYGFNNPDSSPYPTHIGFLLPGAIPPDASQELLPGSTQSYYPDYHFEAWLSSLDGAIIIPWTGPHGLYTIPGTICGSAGCTDTMFIRGAFDLTPAQSEALFGENLDNFSNAAILHLVNHGAPFTLGVGAYASISQAIQFPGISGAGSVQTGGLTGVATINNPEPATLLLASGALALFWGGRRLQRRKRSR